MTTPPVGTEHDLEEVAAAQGSGRDAAENGTRLVIGLVATVAGVIYLVTALRLSRGTLARPGPGMYPQVVGVLTVLTGAVVAWQSRRALTRLRGGWAGVGVPLPWVLFNAALLVVVLTMGRIGFAGAAFILALTILRIASSLSWLKSILMAAAIAVVTTLIFARVFGVYLPTTPYLGF